jgi:hypothetical protein
MTKFVVKKKEEKKKRTMYERGELIFYLSRGFEGLIAIQGERVGQSFKNKKKII